MRTIVDILEASPDFEKTGQWHVKHPGICGPVLRSFDTEEQAISWAREENIYVRAHITQDVYRPITERKIMENLIKELREYIPAEGQEGIKIRDAQRARAADALEEFSERWSEADVALIQRVDELQSQLDAKG